ncbi:MAG: nicotinate-nucleotide--dimethylbenzimidazole phosphoribosyltransferase [Eubacteriales bacterium]
MKYNRTKVDYKEILINITLADSEAIAAAKIRMDQLVKPLGSLGKLEDISIKIAGITGKVKNSLVRKCIVIMSADNGIYEEGVSSSPKEITLLQTINMTKGVCGIGVLSKAAGSELKIVDIGIDGDYDNEKIVNAKVRWGTDNFAKGPAMRIEEAEEAINIGISIIGDLYMEGCQLIGTGEMGIGNTSSSSAVIMALTGSSIEETVGRGGGLSMLDFEKKKRILEAALALNKPDSKNPIDVLYKVGGLDICGLVGCFIGAAHYKIPIVVDGVISIAAALCAYRMNENIKDYIFASHISKEPAFIVAEREIGISPMLDMNMRLGEGTGCPLAFGIIDLACAVMNNMATFEEVAIDTKYLVDNRKGK